MIPWNFGWDLSCSDALSMIYLVCGTLLYCHCWFHELQGIEGHGRYIHFCNHTNLIRNRKDEFVSICQNHQRLSEVLTVKVVGTFCAGTRFTCYFTSGVAMSQNLGLAGWLCHPVVEDSPKECEPRGFFDKCFNYSKLQLGLKQQAVWLQFEVWIWFTQSVFCMLWQQVWCKLWTCVIRWYDKIMLYHCRSQQITSAFILSGL